MIMPSLTSLCRNATNRYYCRDQILQANLPAELKRFLTYENIKDNQSPHNNPLSTVSKNNGNSGNNNNKFQGAPPSSFTSSMARNFAF
jgi:hypothetical protein